MIAEEIGRKYSKALFKLAKTHLALDQIRSDLKTFAKLFDQEPHLKGFLSAPQVSKKDKISVLEKTLKSKVADYFLEFLFLLLKKNRIGYISDIRSFFERLVKEEMGIVPTRVYTSRVLDKALLLKLRQNLEKKIGKKLDIEVIVEPKILGGLSVYIGNRVIDKSVKYQLDSLKEKMLQVKVH